jgi:hypothetical protein
MRIEVECADERWETTLAEFVADNADGLDDEAEATLSAGEQYVAGGGAAPAYRLR